MKFTIKKQVLEKYISNLNSFTEKKDQSAVNSHIYFKIDEQGLVLKATDNEIGLKYLVTDVELKESGDVPEQQKKDILKYINKEGKYSLNRIVKGINNMDKKRKEEERVVKGFKVIKGNKK